MSTYRATENYVYKIDECIGRGATGDVYKGVHKVNTGIKYFYFQFHLKLHTCTHDTGMVQLLLSFIDLYGNGINMVVLYSLPKQACGFVLTCQVHVVM